MIRMWHVAWREFTSVVLTKGFIVGILLTPVIIAIAAGGAALASRMGAPKVEGRLVVVDHTGAVAGGLVKRFSPAATKAEQERMSAQATEMIDKQVGAALPKGTADMAKAQMDTQMRSKAAEIAVEILAPDADIDPIKTQIRATEFRAERAPGEAKPLMGLVVIPKDALVPGDDGAYKTFDLFVAPKLDFEIQSRFERQVGAAIVDARLTADPRIKASGLSPEAIRKVMNAPDAKAVTLTAEGERASMGPLQFIIPAAFMFLLLISVMSAGQYLMTALIEEKSSRVMEVLLSAVSPMQLMVGKILGQMAVAMLILVVYGGLGISGMIFFAAMHLIEPIKLVWFACYFFIAFFTIASMMAAIGSAVNEMREAQTLLTPVMMVIMLPWFLWMPIQRAPNSTFATVLSFTPGISPFIMVIRLGGSEPIPFWQIPASIAVGVGVMFFMAWAAAKVFRIGVLMYGKPPNLATLIKWVRMA